MVKLHDVEYQHLLDAEKECLKGRQEIRILTADLKDARAKLLAAEGEMNDLASTRGRLELELLKARKDAEKEGGKDASSS